MSDSESVVPSDVDAYTLEMASASGWKHGRQLLKKYLMVSLQIPLVSTRFKQKMNPLQNLTSVFIRTSKLANVVDNNLHDR
mgnify:CR=1 FL=1